MPKFSREMQGIPKKLNSAICFADGSYYLSQTQGCRLRFYQSKISGKEQKEDESLAI